MGYKVKVADATEYVGDAVLNSVGADASVYGRLCKNLIQKADEPKIREFLNGKKNCKTGEIFLTGAGKLKCKNIIHVVTPFKDADDEDLTLLKKTYSDVIGFAVKNGFKKIGLPFIGTGANGYSESEAYDAVTSVCSDLAEREENENKEIIDVTIIAYLRPRVATDDEKPVNYPTVDGEIVSNSIRPRYEFGNVVKDDLFQMITFNEQIKAEDYFPIDVKTLRNKYDFIDRFLCEHSKTAEETKRYNKMLRNAGLSKQKRGRLRSNIGRLKNIEIYRLIFSLQMKKTEAIQFMTICGVAFSPLSKLDVFFCNYLNGKYGKARTLYELDEMAYGRIEEGVYFLDSIE